MFEFKLIMQNNDEPVIKTFFIIRSFIYFAITKYSYVSIGHEKMF